VPFEDDVLELVEDQFGRAVVVALYLVADDVHLLVNLRLRVLAVEDDVGQQVSGAVEMVAVDGGVVGGVLLVSKGVQLAAHALQGVDDLQGVAPLRALEGDVFAEVGHSLFAGGLMAGARSYLIATVDHGRWRRQVNDAQAVRQRVGVVFLHNGCKDTK